MLIGVIGKANVGKSTLFKALTLAEAEIANYPFTTISPNRGVAYVSVQCACKEFDVTCKPTVGNCVDGMRFVPIQILDVAGLVPDAHLGKGRGNKFLDDLRQADALIHVVDISGSTNKQGEQATPFSHDPLEDIRWLLQEIDLWYFGLLSKGWDRFSRAVQQEQRVLSEAIAKQFSGLAIKETLVRGILRDTGLDKKPAINWSVQDIKILGAELRKKSKPIIIAANKADINGIESNLKKVQKEIDGKVIGCSAESELALRVAASQGLITYLPGDKSFSINESGNLSEQQKKGLAFIQTVLDRLGSTGLQEVLDSTVYEVLNLIAIFPVSNNKLQDSKGNVLPDCILVQKGTTAQEFAFKVHTELGEKFIRAVDLRTKKTVSKDHIVQHRDVIEIVADR